MKQIDAINVLFHGKIVGELTLTPGGQCAFQYSKEWLASGFSISPIQLPLKNELFIVFFLISLFIFLKSTIYEFLLILKLYNLFLNELFFFQIRQSCEIYMFL